jgi:hypothetical protein
MRRFTGCGNHSLIITLLMMVDATDPMFCMIKAIVPETKVLQIIANIQILITTRVIKMEGPAAMTTPTKTRIALTTRMQTTITKI